MLKNIRTRAIWMAIGIVIGGSALSYAGVAATSSHKPTNKPSAHSSVEPKESEAPEPSESPEADNPNRPHNHGFYVSQAAQCKDVNDTVKQAAGAEDPFDRHESAFRFGYGAQRHYKTQYPTWNSDLDNRLSQDYGDNYKSDRDYIRHAYEYKYATGTPMGEQRDERRP